MIVQWKLYTCYSVSASADILDRVSPKFHRLGLTYECLGGGRIDHNSTEKAIKVYGYSVVSDIWEYTVITDICVIMYLENWNFVCESLVRVSVVVGVWTS